MPITFAKLDRDIRRLRAAAARYRLTPWQAGLRFLRLYRKERYSPDEIFMLGMLDPMGIGRTTIVSKERLLALQLALSPSGYRRLLDDKLAFHGHCVSHGIATPRLLATYGAKAVNDVPRLSTARDWEAFWAGCGEVDVVIKPVDGLHGLGVRRVFWTGEAFRGATGEALSPDALRAALDAGEDDEWLIQQRLLPHEALIALSGSDGLQTLRVVTYASAGGEVEIMAVWLRIIASGEFFDNFHRGRSGNAVGVVDTARGVLGAVYRMDPSGLGLTRLDFHPTTGRTFDGFTVPHWGAVRELVLAAASAFCPLRTIGWDVAVTPVGPLLIEGNHTWGPLPGNPGMGVIFRRLQEAAAETSQTAICGVSK